MPKLIWFLRVTEMVNETNIRIILEKMKNLNITRSIIITSANFSRMAIEYAESRPIELYDKERLKDLLGKIKMD
jgi:restriction endonuclease Mrr